MIHRSLAWALAALLGIALTLALTWSVTTLTAQRIGLGAEPTSVIRGLAPAVVPSVTRPHEPRPEAPSDASETADRAAPRAPSQPTAPASSGLARAGGEPPDDGAGPAGSGSHRDD